MPRTQLRRHFRSAGLPLALIAFAINLLLPSSSAPTQARFLSQTPQQRVAASSATQSAQDIRTLAPGTPIERELAGGESHSYRIRLNAGEYLHVAVDQRGIDVVVMLRGSDGALLTEMDGLSGMRGVEELSWEAASSSGYTMEVRAKAKAANSGRYEVRVQKAAAAGGKERARIAAERMFMEGRRAQAEQSGEALERAAKRYEAAVEKWREADERKWEGLTLNNLGTVYRNLSRYERAREYFELALALRREIKDKQGEGATLNNLGNVYNQLSQYERARDYYEQALATSREVKDKRVEGMTLHNLGSVHNRLSRYERARDYFERALAVEREIKDRHGEGETLNNLANAYLRLSQYEKALNYYEQALTICRELKYRKGEAETLSGLSHVYSYLGQFEKERDYSEQSLVISREIKDRHGEGEKLNNLGNVYHRLSQSERARDYYELALAIAREIKNRQGEGATLHNLGLLYSHLGQLENALNYYEQALTIRREVKDKSGEGGTLHNIMTLWKSLDRPPLAIFYGKQSVNAYQQIRANIQGLERESQQSFLKSKEDSYRQLADLLIAQGRLPEAQQVLDLLKEEEFRGFVTRGSNNPPAAADALALNKDEAAWQQRYREIADRVSEIGQQYTALREQKQLSAEQKIEFARLEADLGVAQQAFGSFLARLHTEFGRSDKLDQQTANQRIRDIKEFEGFRQTLREMRRAGERAVALYTVVSKERYSVILVTPDTVVAGSTKISEDELNKKVTRFRDLIGSQRNTALDVQPQAEELYRIVVPRVIASNLQKAKAKVLMWSLDGVLRYVPMAALHDGRQYLVEQYANVVITPASRDRLKDKAAEVGSGLGLGVSKGWPGFAALSAVPDELRSIIRQEAGLAQVSAAARGSRAASGVLKGKVLLDEAFTLAAMKEELRAGGYAVVVIASHFEFRPGTEADSYLLLGDGKQLTLEAINNSPDMFNGVEVLTLSACNTATGGALGGGKEVDGLGEVAQRQGAKTVVATLWKVYDESTREAMRAFYQRWVVAAGGEMRKTKAEALQQAQVEMLRSSSRYKHPYYWAPFIMIGNWR